MAAAAVIEGLTIGKAVAILTGVALIILGLALLAQLMNVKPLALKGGGATSNALRATGWSTGAYPSADDASAAGATQPVTLVLNPEGVDEGMFLDLDTGRLYSPPADVVTPDAMVVWMREHGADVLYAQDVSGAALLAVDMLSERLAGTDEAAEAAAFFHRTAGAAVSATVQKLEAQGDVPVSYAYRTREGGTGVLEIDGFQKDAARGMRITLRPAPRNRS